jgi:hypothetical protein
MLECFCSLYDQQVIKMDQLLYGILLSDKANAIKCKVVDQFRKAGCRKQAVKDVHGVLNCCKRFILERKDDQQILLWSKQIFSAWASCNYNAFEEYFSAALTDELFVFGHSNVAGALWIIQEGLRILQTHQLQTYIVVCSYVGQRAANFIRDNSDFTLVVDFCQILLEHPECLPPSSSSLLRVFCSTLLRVVSQFDVPTDDEKSSYFLCNVPNVIGMLLQRIWLQNKESLENSLRTVFDVICSCNKTTGIKAIGAVVQFIPNEVMQAAVWSEATATKLDDQQVMDLLDRMILMLTWPHIKQADAWIVCYMRGLASAGRYMMLSHFAYSRIDQVKSLSSKFCRINARVLFFCDVPMPLMFQCNFIMC